MRKMMSLNCSICLMPVFGAGKVYRIWTPKGGPPQFSTWMFVSSFLPFVVSSFGWTFEAAEGVPSVMLQPQKQGCHTLQRVDLARPFLVSPAIKIEIGNSLAMALSKAKSGSAWQSHFWQCGMLRATRDTKLLAWRKWIKVGFYLSSKLSTQLGRTTCWSPKSQCVYGPENEIVAVTFFAKIGAALTNSSALASPTERQDPGERLLIEGLIAPPRAKEHVANLSQSTMLFGIVGVVGAGFHSMAWVRCWFRCDIAGRMPFLRLPWQWIVFSWSGIALLSFVLVSWCVVCFWAPPSPPRLITRQLCGSDCVCRPEFSIIRLLNNSIYLKPDESFVHTGGRVSISRLQQIP